MFSTQTRKIRKTWSILWCNDHLSAAISAIVWTAWQLMHAYLPNRDHSHTNWRPCSQLVLKVLVYISYGNGRYWLHRQVGVHLVHSNCGRSGGRYIIILCCITKTTRPIWEGLGTKLSNLVLWFKEKRLYFCHLYLKVAVLGVALSSTLLSGELLVNPGDKLRIIVICIYIKLAILLYTHNTGTCR